jgi:hypothetical protein
MDFDYSFDTSRNPDDGYVQAATGTNPKKLSFVGNSGVKFGDVSDPNPNKKAYEAAILDVSSMIDVGGGLQVFDGGIDNYGNVIDPPYLTEPLNRLMTGVKYGGDYSKMSDYNAVNPSDPPTSGDFYQTLVNNASRGSGHMTIEATLTGAATYAVGIYIDGSLTYYDDGESIENLNQIYLQSHWGSGVVFSNLNITQLSPP